MQERAQENHWDGWWRRPSALLLHCPGFWMSDNFGLFSAHCKRYAVGILYSVETLNSVLFFRKVLTFKMLAGDQLGWTQKMSLGLQLKSVQVFYPPCICGSWVFRKLGWHLWAEFEGLPFWFCPVLDSSPLLCSGCDCSKPCSLVLQTRKCCFPQESKLFHATVTWPVLRRQATNTGTFLHAFSFIQCPFSLQSLQEGRCVHLFVIFLFRISCRMSSCSLCEDGSSRHSLGHSTGWTPSSPPGMVPLALHCAALLWKLDTLTSPESPASSSLFTWKIREAQLVPNPMQGFREAGRWSLLILQLPLLDLYFSSFSHNYIRLIPKINSLFTVVLPP